MSHEAISRPKAPAQHSDAVLREMQLIVEARCEGLDSDQVAQRLGISRNRAARLACYARRAGAVFPNRKGQQPNVPRKREVAVEHEEDVRPPAGEPALIDDIAGKLAALNEAAERAQACGQFRQAAQLQAIPRDLQALMRRLRSVLAEHGEVAE